MTDFKALLQVLSRADVRFIVIGGVAAGAHGAARSTLDLDVVYDRSAENLERLIEVKRAAGRPKDFEAIAELEVLLEEKAGS